MGGVMILDLILGGGWKILVAIGAGIVALLAWTNRKREGAREERAAQEAKGAQTRREVEEDLARTPAAERRKRMLEWKR